MKKAIVTTTINEPTKALQAFLKIAHEQDWHIFVVGDQKTPHAAWTALQEQSEKVTYLHPDKQVEINSRLSDLIGWNCIQRRNFGFIAAYAWGADIIATVDDDNIPMENWGKNLLVGGNHEVPVYSYKEKVDGNMPVFDPLAPTAQGANIWHRGFPVQMLKGRTQLNEPVMETRYVRVQADLWNGDPDIDAICRIAKNPLVRFDTVKRAYAGAKMGPFNSQNTFVHRSVLRDYFMFPHIGRMDDIWAAYWLQSRNPNSVVYGPASVRQDRNEHNLVKDLEAELIGYRHSKEFAEFVVSDAANTETVLPHFPDFMPELAIKAFDVYRAHLAALDQ